MTQLLISQKGIVPGIAPETSQTRGHAQAFDNKKAERHG